MESRPPIDLSQLRKRVTGQSLLLQKWPIPSSFRPYALNTEPPTNALIDTSVEIKSTGTQSDQAVQHKALGWIGLCHVKMITGF